MIGEASSFLKGQEEKRTMDGGESGESIVEQNGENDEAWSTRDLARAFCDADFQHGA